MKIFKSILLLIVSIITGLSVVILFSKISLPEWLHSAVPIVITFIILNVATDRLLKINAVRTNWRLQKIYFFPLAIVAGGIIAILPVLITVKFDDIIIQPSGSLNAILITLCIVSWEELWFRNVILNYCERYMSAIGVSLLIGVLFMLLHTLNPEISLIKEGPSLFAAGTLLTITYLHYRTIWLPLGLHFGNNFISSRLDTQANDGYISAAVILILCIVLFIKHNRSGRST